MNQASALSIQPSKPLTKKERFKQKLLDFASKTSGRPISFVIMFFMGVTEAVLCPLPSDEVLISMGAFKPRRALAFSMCLILGMAVGGVGGYFIGYYAFQSVGQALVSQFGMEAEALSLLSSYRTSGVEILLTSGFTPIPYTMYTMLAGANHTIPVLTFTLAAFVGRALRFLPVGLVIHFMGPKISPFLTKHLDRIILVFTIFMFGFLLVRLFFHYGV
jgi:membrane protein YqaA with SNARE-associated domain